MRNALLAVLALMGILGKAQVVHAQSWADMTEFSGYLDSDVRFLVEDDRGPTAGDGYRFDMNRNDLDLKLTIRPFDQVKAVVDSRLRFYGFNEAASLPELVKRDPIDPYSLYLDEAYVGIQGFLFEGIDLRFGRMVQTWGAVDQFNPTDNLSARDLSDPFNYSAKVPNQMIELSAYPTDWLTLTGVFVPVFKPAQLPPSALMGFAVEYDANGCFAKAPVPPLSTADVASLQELFSAVSPCNLNFVDPEVRTLTPESTIENSQAGFKAAFQAGDLDFSLSYYYGRFAFPVAYTAVAHVDPNVQTPGVFDVKYVAEVLYPRMHVAGADFSYSAPWLFDIGFVGEIAVYFPEEVIFGMRAFQQTEPGSAEQGPPKRALVAEKSALNVPSDPFIKATAGFDYTILPWWYVNAMYVRGFFDEFNDAYGIRNYAVGATELKFFEDEVVLRLAAVLAVDDLSATLNPQLTWIVYPSAEIALAGLIFLGDTEPDDPFDYAAKEKFGQKAAGRSTVALRARVTW
ncbi:MAG: hypothetical protein FJ109_01440 [Deltaproteobacteria bacterium]|nr:hypothetical protein [Deltaproteobacteria bacterium]